MRDGRCPFEVVSGVPVVTAPEEIDITNAPELRSALLEAAAHGHRTLVVDMTRTQFCDSSGMHALLAAHRHAQAKGGELLLAITAAPVLRVLALTTIDRMIPTFTSLDQALAQTSANGSNGHQRADRTLPDLPSDRARSGRALTLGASIRRSGHVAQDRPSLVAAGWRALRRGIALGLVAALVSVALSACGSSPGMAPGTASVVSTPVHIAHIKLGAVGYRAVGNGPPLVLIMGYG